jgi:pimeloyl-ACP methyl ester carboxylesterase
MPVLYNLLSNFASFRKLDGAARPGGFPPCCMIWGRQNHILSAVHGEEYARRFGADDCYMIDDCGHMVMREKHESVNHIMSEFLFRNGAYYRGSE